MKSSRAAIREQAIVPFMHVDEKPAAFVELQRAIYDFGLSLNLVMAPDKRERD